MPHRFVLTLAVSVFLQVYAVQFHARADEASDQPECAASMTPAFPALRVELLHRVSGAQDAGRHKRLDGFIEGQSTALFVVPDQLEALRARADGDVDVRVRIRPVGGAEAQIPPADELGILGAREQVLVNSVLDFQIQAEPGLVAFATADGKRVAEILLDMNEQYVSSEWTNHERAVFVAVLTNKAVYIVLVSTP